MSRVPHCDRCDVVTNDPIVVTTDQDSSTRLDFCGWFCIAHFAKEAVGEENAS